MHLGDDILHYHRVDLLFHGRYFFRSHLSEVTEVEPQPVRGDQRTFLFHMFAQDFPQRMVHEVCCRMVVGSILPGFGINGCFERQ